ncbi:hypothetical protein K432DRAFT_396511 [Lepidopterella palustris CBS 459.81]|uniref:Zn(2)-C6 fungal-type domain-containing protein n=1 Tax=Lepidopterella palustris CBS 459.81 TaxID=1314670 RepID=A0A8E2E379_9PEZI|nr:hypothetical protein K432DRAFT_396511 [Lepidopterella palustris CBS 459.81]
MKTTNRTPESNRNNQRNFRERRKEHIRNLENKVRIYERQGVQASQEIRRVARYLAAQNIQLLALLAAKGASQDEILAAEKPDMGEMNGESSEQLPVALLPLTPTPGSESNEINTFAKNPTRALKACKSCRDRKVKCDVTEDGSPCTNCRRGDRECTVPNHKRIKQENPTVFSTTLGDIIPEVSRQRAAPEHFPGEECGAYFSPQPLEYTEGYVVRSLIVAETRGSNHRGAPPSPPPPDTWDVTMGQLGPTLSEF